ncbi:leucine-rich repeat-containing protein 74B isoform X2 [Ictidomys tridecemlineatus]
MGVTMKGPCERLGENEDQREEAIAPAGCFAGVPEADKDSEADSDSDLETEDIHGLREPIRDALHLGSCQAYGIVPTIYFLNQGCAPELKLRHRGLGPQGAWALASMLISNPYIKRLDLQDNGLCVAGAEALAYVLSKNSSICDVDLSENQIGVAGAQALCAALKVNQAVQKIQLAGNSLEEKAAQYLAELLLVHTGLKSLDVSYNQLNDQAGETLGPALAENTGLTELNISWNHLRGPGAIVFARGLEANIFLKVLDISFNGFGDSGASAVGEALKANNVLEELNMSNNRISATGARHLGLGLRVNQTLRILVVSRNPMQTEGCSHLLKSVRDNPASALELLDFSVRAFSKPFSDPPNNPVTSPFERKEMGITETKCPTQIHQWQVRVPTQVSMQVMTLLQLCSHSGLASVALSDLGPRLCSSLAERAEVELGGTMLNMHGCFDLQVQHWARVPFFPPQSQPVLPAGGLHCWKIHLWICVTARESEPTFNASLIFFLFSFFFFF